MAVERFPVLPLRDVVVFPHVPVSLIVGRPKSVAALQAAYKDGKDSGLILLVAQRVGSHADPTLEELYDVGCLCRIDQVLRLPDGNLKVLVVGVERLRIVALQAVEPFLAVEGERFPPTPENTEIQALVRSIQTSFEAFVGLNRGVPPEMLTMVQGLSDPARLADALVAPLQLKVEERQALLSMPDVQDRLQRVFKALLTEIEFLQVEKKLKARVRRDREQGQREVWLDEQVKALKEGGEKDASELDELTEKLAAKNLPDEVRLRGEKELRRLGQMNPMSAEATVVRNYLDWMIALPWQMDVPRPTPDLAHAAEVLDADHHGLDEIKDRMIEHLAVSSLVKTVRGPILCMVGPPGVGKTSLARSIARATGRAFVKIALGGVRDEAEIRGHRRTYIGAMPGKILHGMKRAKEADPILLLDEIDKLSSDIRGDPASALLEVLDYEQNATFNDHYMDLDFDLSKATFICTANSIQDIPLPLQDRLEIITVPGYTQAEKQVIAKTYLLKRQLGLNGVTDAQLTLTDAGLLRVIQEYTKESGVRGLERALAKLCRKVARRVVAEGPEIHMQVDAQDVPDLLGIPKYRQQQADKEDQVGVVTGLAVSPWGGETLGVEVAIVPGKGKLLLTGRLGDWLKESANAGLTFVRTRQAELGLQSDFTEHIDIHIHYPGNPLKTDGPSAGITMATALVSALTKVPARADTAMTGEVSLRGGVFPIGGLKEKVLAAHRAGITRVLVPEENRKDLADIPDEIAKSMEFIVVSHMDEVLKAALRHS